MEKIVAAVRIRPVEEQDQEQIGVMKHGENGVIAKKHSDKFTYEYVHGQEATNQQIFEINVRPLLERAIKGYNVCIFTYGQTSSGKTFTMKGTRLQPGIIPLSLEYIFEYFENIKNHQLEKSNRKIDSEVSLNYIEIYNEKINDLLQRGNCDLRLRMRKDKSLLIENLSENIVENSKDAISYFVKGEQERKFAETKMNHSSSRSHCVFKINLSTKIQNSKTTIKSTINLIDLAGSEGVAKSDIGGKRLKEGSSINRSLLSMYNVIKKLNKKADFICFRESKLTRILQPYLGGNSLTSIICNINPKISNYQESVNTLRFALCAGGIKNNVKINVEGGKNFKEIEAMEENMEDIQEKKKEYEIEFEEVKEKIVELRELRNEKLNQVKELKANKENFSFELSKIFDEKSEKLRKLNELKNSNIEKQCLIEEYKQKFKKLKETNIFEKMDEMSVKFDNKMAHEASKNERLLTDFSNAEKRLESLTKLLKEKTQKIEDLKNKNAFLQDTTNMLSKTITPQNNGRLKSSMSNVKKHEIKNLIKLLTKENQIIELMILSEQKRLENFEQVKEYNRTKARYHDMRYKCKEIKQRIRDSQNREPEQKKSNIDIYSSNRKARSTVFLQEGSNYKTCFATQFELDLFSSAKSSRKKSIFGHISAAKSVKGGNTESMLVKRKPIGSKYKAEYAGITKKVKNSPDKNIIFKEIKNLRNKVFAMETRLCTEYSKTSMFKRKLFDLNTLQKELMSYCRYLEGFLE